MYKRVRGEQVCGEQACGHGPSPIADLYAPLQCLFWSKVYLAFRTSVWHLQVLETHVPLHLHYIHLLPSGHIFTPNRSLADLSCGNILISFSKYKPVMDFRGLPFVFGCLFPLDDQN